MKSADGKSEIREIPLKKDTYLHISIIGANRSKVVWGDDAEEFRPERWLVPSLESVVKTPLPGVYSSMSVKSFTLRSLSEINLIFRFL